MLEIAGLNAWYGESHILHGVDFNVQEGEVVQEITNKEGLLGTVKNPDGTPVKVVKSK